MLGMFWGAHLQSTPHPTITPTPANTTTLDPSPTPTTSPPPPSLRYLDTADIPTNCGKIPYLLQLQPGKDAVVTHIAFFLPNVIKELPP